MDTFVARLHQPATLVFATLVAALMLLALALALGVALGSSPDVEPLFGPFRWQSVDQFIV